MAIVRIIAIGVAAALVWTVAASRVSSQERLPLAAIVPGAVETLPFGCTSFALEPFDPLCPGLHIHTGVDLAAAEGTAVHAASAGTAFAGFDAANCGVSVVVVVDQSVRLLYCHLSRVRVAAGDSVTPGEVIGEVGSTGLATGAHLHFEVQVNGRAVDPVAWLSN